MSSQNTLSFWQLIPGQYQQPQTSSTTTSTSSSRYSSSSSLGSLLQHTQRLQDSKQEQGGARRGNWLSGSEPEDGPWGQFVDTAEAEEELVRHSKILSKRNSM